MKNDDYFEELSVSQDVIKERYRRITDKMEHAIKGKKIQEIFDCISFIESENGHALLKYVPEIHVYLRILYIITLEKKNDVTVENIFWHECDNLQSVHDKYHLTVFALRRLYFHLSKDSVNEARSYLRDNSVSIIAIYVITMDVLKLKETQVQELLQEYE